MSAAGAVAAKEARFASPGSRALAVTAALGLHALAAFAFLRPHAPPIPEEQSIEVTVEADPTAAAPSAPAPEQTTAPAPPAPEQPAAPVEPTTTPEPQPTQSLEPAPKVAPAEVAAPPPSAPAPERSAVPVEPTPSPEPAPITTAPVDVAAPTPEQTKAPVEPATTPEPRPSPPPPPPKEAPRPVTRPSLAPPPRPHPPRAVAKPLEPVEPPVARARLKPSPERTVRSRREKEEAEGERSAAKAREEERARPRESRSAREEAPGLSGAAYGALVSAEIARHKFYPPAARAEGLSGSVGVMVTIGASGRVVSHSIVRSSGHAELDDAVAAIMSAVQVPPPPGGVFRARLTLRFATD